MPKSHREKPGMRLKLLQEAIWNNGDKLDVLLQQSEAIERELTRLIYLMKGFTQRLGLLLYGNKRKSKTTKRRRTNKR